MRIAQVSQMVPQWKPTSQPAAGHEWTGNTSAWSVDAVRCSSGALDGAAEQARDVPPRKAEKRSEPESERMFMGSDPPRGLLRARSRGRPLGATRSPSECPSAKEVTRGEEGALPK